MFKIDIFLNDADNLFKDTILYPSKQLVKIQISFLVICLLQLTFHLSLFKVTGV